MKNADITVEATVADIATEESVADITIEDPFADIEDGSDSTVDENLQACHVFDNFDQESSLQEEGYNSEGVHASQVPQASASSSPHSITHKTPCDSVRAARNRCLCQVSNTSETDLESCTAEGGDQSLSESDSESHFTHHAGTCATDFDFDKVCEAELRNLNPEEENYLDEELSADEEPLSDNEFDFDPFDEEPHSPLNAAQEESNKVDYDSDPLYPGAAITIGAFMLLLAVFTSKYNLIGEATEHLLKILALALPNGHKLCTSLYEFKLFFKNLKNPLLRHYYCSACLGYMPNSSLNSCPYEFCKCEFSVKTGSYFVEIPLENQIRNLFAQNGFYESLGHRFRRKNAENKYMDIYDGRIYKNLMENNGILGHQENISFTLNTDGAPVFKSSKTSIWPIYLVINELPYKQRMQKENMILASLWYGSKKPSMGTFLKPFLQSLSKLKEGIQCTSPERGSFLCKGILLCGTADLPARSLLCNHVQYNGAFSCWKCEQEGETASVGKGHTRVFPYQGNSLKGPKRTSEKVLEQAKSAVEKKQTEKGIKGPSWLCFAPDFDIVNGIAIDYMHEVLLGVQKLLLELWFNIKYKGKVFNFYDPVCEIDRRLQFIKPTLDITRLPRSIEKDLKYWKASEYRSFLLYFGAPVLSGILDDQRFSHYLLLVDAIHILLKCGSTNDDLNRAETLLLAFCQNFECLYERCFLRLNVHQLLHLPDCVRDLGPLYTQSCFSFESKNGLVLKMIRGSQSIDTQIITAVSFIQKLPELKQRFVEKNSEIDRLCKAIEEPTMLKRGQKIDSGVYILGAPCERKLSENEFHALQSFLQHDPVCDLFKTFIRIEYHEFIIYGSEYSRMKKRNNSVVFYEGEDKTSFGEVQFFLIIEDDFLGTKRTLVFIRKLRCRNYRESAQILSVVCTNDLEVVNLKNVISSCMLVSFPGAESAFVCRFPNRLESD